MIVPRWTRSVGAGIVVALVGYAGYASLYSGPRDRLLTQIEKARGDIAAFEEALKERPAARQELKRLAATTLPGSADEADALLRTALNTLADEAGLTTIRVDTNRPEDVANPVGTSRLATPMRSQIRKQKEFAVIRATVSGVGTIEQTVRCIAALQAQPWIHRRESFSLAPANKERTTFTLRVTVASVLLPPELAPKPVDRLALVAASPSVLAECMELSRKWLFREPPAVAPTAVAKADPPADTGPKPPPSPAFHEWKLTGVVESPRLGVEAWVVNTRTQERLSLGVGSAVENATFLAGGGERAVFEIAGARFEVFNGQTLAQRRPCER